MSEDKKEICCELFDIQKWIPEFLIVQIALKGISRSRTLNALSFVCTPDDRKRKALCFRETLMVCLKSESARDSKPIGGYCILVESIGPQAHELLVHVQSSMFIDGHFGGSKVISSATSKFHCLEEKRTEFVYEDDGLHEKTIYIGSEDNFYHVKLIRTCPCDGCEETKDLSCHYNSKFISEGVNILLMRYLALINYEGMLSFNSITTDGEITTSNYTCNLAEHMELDGHYLSVYTIERKIHREDGTVHTVRTYLTPQGKILRHNWLDVPYILKLNPLVDPKMTNKTIRITTPLRDRWKEDIEMFSKYLDVKYSNIAEQMEYLADHPEVKQLIADYTQTLLVGNEFLNGINILPILLRQVFCIPHFTVSFNFTGLRSKASERNRLYDTTFQSVCQMSKILGDQYFGREL
ncbi:ciliogenesis-associated TTC17-interacting protein [Andrena cerasifolii]|uniref:ciliogenesis-associated TTC17-interacting protein n=1 Tax=Andrena cerasifolii TaxID=2819439 RepID=UPI0040378EF4